MNRAEMLRLVRSQMTEHRYQHTLGVVQTAIQLAERYGADRDRAEVAAIFHDYAKFRPAEEMKKLISSQAAIPDQLLNYNKELWHAPVGAYLVQTEAGIQDEEIVTAIRYHTTGRRGMSLLEKVIWLADYIEPGRHFPGVEEVREIAQVDLDQALIKAMQNSISFLEKRGELVYPDTREAYQQLMEHQAELSQQKDAPSDTGTQQGGE